MVIGISDGFGCGFNDNVGSSDYIVQGMSLQWVTVTVRKDYGSA